MKKILLAAMLLTGCTNSTKTNSVLENEGYTNIKTTGYSWFTCGKDDFYKTGFAATTKDGKQVKGAVCGGFTKGYTIRLK